MSQDYSKVGKALEDYHQVKFGSDVRLSKQCSVVGKVEIGNDVTIFAGAHVRGDCAPISIGSGTNIQENCTLHVSGGMPLSIGKNVTVGHGAIVHGCTIEDNVLIGMGAIVMDGAHIGKDSLIAAGAIVTEGKEFPPKSLIMGVPAKVVRELTDEQLETHVTLAAIDYQEVGYAMFADGLLYEPSKDANIWSSEG